MKLNNRILPISVLVLASLGILTSHSSLAQDVPGAPFVCGYQEPPPGDGGGASLDTTPDSLGAQRIMVIKVLPEGTTEEPNISTDEIVKMITKIGDSYREDSYNQMWFVGANNTPFSSKDVYPQVGSYPITVGEYVCDKNLYKKCDGLDDATTCINAGTTSEGQCKVICDAVSKLTQAAVNAAQNDFTSPLNPDQNTQIVIIAGQCLLTRGAVALPGGVLQGNIESIFTLSSDHSSITHELGHNFGMNHAGYRQCTEGQNINDCPLRSAYSDLYDFMGSGPYFADSTAFLKEKVFWLTPTGQHQILDITPQLSGTTQYLDSLEKQSPGVKALKFQRDQEGRLKSHMYIEWRGLEEVNNIYRTRTNVRDGVLLHVAPDKEDVFRYGMDVSLFDPFSFRSELDAALPYNTSYTDPGSGTVITVGPDPRGIPNAKLEVTVNLGRTDFKGPVIGQLHVEELEPCVADIWPDLSDDSGISRVVFYYAQNMLDTDPVIGESTQPPFKLHFDIRTRKRPIWFRVYDNAKQQGESTKTIQRTVQP